MVAATPQAECHVGAMQQLREKHGKAVATRDRIVIGRVSESRRGMFVVARRIIAGTVVGALAVAAAIAVPALGAPDSAHRNAAQKPGASFFTPTAADPRLAALVARSGLGSRPFAFTPADSRGTPRRVAALPTPVVAPKAVVTLRGSAVTLPGTIAPFAYSLDGAAPQKRAAPINGDIKFDLVSPGSKRAPVDVAASFSGRRATSKFKAATDRPTNGDARLAEGGISKVDVGGSYSLSKNIDVSAGVRYKAQDRDRLAPLPENQRDGQSVYVGTAFRF